ncbi:hypothetical protein [Paraburkholderia bannensis]|uniref:hypothetical protein n=1 Tax=Paraburkholderia bannensis TaxID=765414 RepID=UPI002AB6577D|nr:hypothetical protein [Paraburkholderia bannensis]
MFPSLFRAPFITWSAPILRCTSSVSMSRRKKSQSAFPSSIFLQRPLDEKTATEMALAHHLTFAACKSWAGTTRLVSELVRMVYLTFYVQCAGYGDTDIARFTDAEAALENCILRAGDDETCWIAPSECALVEPILRQADTQLFLAPRLALIDAYKRLDKFLRSSNESPLPQMAV